MPQPPSAERSRRPSNPGLRALIQGKRQWSHGPNDSFRALGFRGWHERGYLPHCDLPNIKQIVTFNLADAFPVARRAEWQVFLHLPNQSEVRRQLEAWLDRGAGECWLRKPALAALVEEALLKDHRRQYCLQAWTIMSNHVHVVLDLWTTPLSLLVKQWKGATAAKANRVLGRTGQFWQQDYWDTRVRNEKHLQQAIRYVENNPVRARLVAEAKEWPWSSARPRDEYGRLMV
jgi:REP element-mobilizing transposase RayT